MKTQHSAAIVLLVVALVTNTSHTGAESIRTAVETQLHGTIMVKDHTTYSHRAKGFSETADTTCTTRITVNSDGSATAHISYTARHARDETSNGQESKMTAGLQGTGTVAYDARLTVTVGPAGTARDRSYQITADVPTIEARGTRTDEMTGRAPVTSTWTESVRCTRGYADVVLSGQVGQTTTLGGTVTYEGHFGWVNQEVGSSMETWSVVDPQLLPVSNTCSARPGQGASTMPGARAMQVSDTLVARARGNVSCRWYGTIHWTKSWNSGKPILTVLNKGIWYSRQGACEITYVFSKPDTVKARLNYSEWTNDYESITAGKGYLYQEVHATFTRDLATVSPGQLPFGAYTTRDMTGSISVSGTRIAADAILIAVQDATLSYAVDGATFKLLTFATKAGSTANCYPVGFEFDPRHPQGRLHPFSNVTNGVPATVAIDWTLYQQ
jgi:hypothetical protein